MGMIRTEQSHIPVAARTHPGRRGKNNEDRYGVFTYRLADSPTGRGVPVLLAVLADGIGGHRAGEVAAEMAVAEIERTVAASDGSHPAQIMEEAIARASDAIFARAQENPDQTGMGSTCAIAWVVADRLFTATVGDSRIYLLRGSHIQQLSVDHTWIQEALERGLLKPEETQNHPNAHVIRRYLGSPTPPQVDFRLRLTEEQGTLQAMQNQGLALQTGDVVLLCSDGLSDLVDAPEILNVIRAASDLNAAADQLVAMANERGGHDNITLIVAQMQPLPVGTAAPAALDPGSTAQVPVIPGRRSAPQAAPAPVRARPLQAGCAVAAIVLLLAALVVGAFFVYQNTIGAPDATATATPPLTIEAPGNLPTLPTQFMTRTPSVRTPRPTRTTTVSATNTPGTAGNATITPWPTHTFAP